MGSGRSLLDVATDNFQVLAPLHRVFGQLLFRELVSLVPILWWLGIVEIHSVHLGNVTLLVPGYASVSMLDVQFLIFDAVFFEKLEKWFISSDLDRPQLIVIPMITMHVFDVTLALSSERMMMYSRAVSTNENSKPN